jgi:hypothetical protein
MELKKRLTLALASGLPVAALAVYYMVGTPQIAQASCGSGECEYASGCYSEGACVRPGCDSGSAQKCGVNGWGNCGSNC